MKAIKAILAAIGGAFTGPSILYFALPPDVHAPWWVYLLVSALNAFVHFCIVYAGPANKST